MKYLQDQCRCSPVHTAEQRHFLPEFSYEQPDLAKLKPLIRNMIALVFAGAFLRTDAGPAI
ncbi:hypothetical protein ACFW4D_08295 [Paenibacillus lactis]|uniref:hypothetical protein n=1 Tax=Paenibacillus lactis TaxID=228574 RepID=UPI0004B76C53